MTRRLTLSLIALLLILAWKWMMKNQQSAPTTFVLPMNYINATSALAADDLDKAREALAALANESTGDLRAKAKAAASSSDMAGMRESFKTLTEEVAIHMSYPDDYAVAFCPMYKNGSKWIQRREAPIANPYLGQSVPPCGSFVD